MNVNIHFNPGGIVAETFDIKFKIILARESSKAKTVALSLIKSKPLTVWEVMIPVIFILNYCHVKLDLTH